MLTLIENAFVAGGNELFEASVVIKDDKIIEVVKDPSSGMVYDQKFDAGGKVLAPGFIDCHSHSDISCLAAPECYGKISQGITSEIVGNCGLSVFPLTDHNREHLEDLYESYNEKLDWNDLASYRRKIRERQVALNIFTLCGHNSLRAAVSGYDTRSLGTNQLETMGKLLDDALKTGALGMSTGLLYVPGIFASDGEITALMEILAEANAVYTTHLRSEGNEIVESLAETCQWAEKARLNKLHISHLKIAGAANHHKIDQVLEIFEQAGGNMSCDRYPYIESMTQLSVILPVPFDDYDDVTLQQRLREDDFGAAVLAALESLEPRRFEQVRLVNSNDSRFALFNGRNFAQIATELAVSPARLCLDILKTDAPGATAAFCGMSSDNMRRILSLPCCACATDESARPLDYSIGRSHPRGFGSFPRFFEILKAEGFSIAQIVYKMSTLPAGIFKLPLRGRIKKGFFADLVLFDPDKFSSSADFAHPHRQPRGAEKVWVNGMLRFDTETT